MQIQEVVKIKEISKKRVGRGQGSGRGKTSGRGTKGMKARGKVRLGFIGGSLPLYRKLPLKKGKGNRKAAPKLVGISLNKLTIFKPGTVIDIEALLKANIINKREARKGVKVLGVGDIENALTIVLPVSESVRQKIVSKGGKIESV